MRCLLHPKLIVAHYLTTFHITLKSLKHLHRYPTNRQKLVGPEVIVSQHWYSGWGYRGTALLSFSQNVTMLRNTPDNMPPPFLSPDLHTKCCGQPANLLTSQQKQTSYRDTPYCASPNLFCYAKEPDVPHIKSYPCARKCLMIEKKHILDCDFTVPCFTYRQI